MRWRSTILIGPLLLAGCGGGESAAALFGRALDALGDNRPREAEAAAEAAARRGGEPYAALLDFLRGNTAFSRCLLAEKQAAMPQSEPFAYDLAINYARSARDAWRRAAASRADWPRARRNVERALLKIEDLERQKAQRERPRKRTDPQPKPRPKAKPTPKSEPTPPKEAKPELQVEELPPAELKKLLDRLAQREREKRALRRSQRKARMAGERDW